jgi:hypothetical protein
MPPLFSPITLEVVVLLLGFFLLFAESFSKGEDKSWMAKLSIYILAIVFAWSFFTTGDTGVDLTKSFYTADATALFFKRIALLTTMVVLVMALEFKGVLAKFIPAGRSRCRSSPARASCSWRRPSTSSSSSSRSNSSRSASTSSSPTCGGISPRSKPA